MVKSRSCPAESAVKLIGGRWKIVILWYLFQGVHRYSELRRTLTGITQKVLTQQLRDMERDGIVARTVYAEVPPKVEYSVTPLGLSLKPVVEAMHRWGIEHSFQKGCPNLDAIIAGPKLISRCQK